MKNLFRLIALISIMFGVSALASAQSYYAGDCQQGGQTVSTLGSVSTTKVQRTYPSCTVTIYDAGTTNLATITTDGSTPKANPFTAASDGSWSFYKATGTIDVRFSGGGIVTPFTRAFWPGTPVGSQSYASVCAAVSSLGSTILTLQVSTAWASGGSCTVPATMKLQPMAGGSIVLGSGHAVIVLSDTSKWPVEQMFSGTGTVSFAGNSATKQLYPQWWGASSSAVKATNTTAFQATINAATASSIPMYVPRGTYDTGSLTIPESTTNAVFTMIGAGCGLSDKTGTTLGNQWGTIFNFTNADGTNFLKYTSASNQNPTLILRDFQVIGPDVEGGPRTTTSGSGIVVTSTAGNPAIALLQFTNVRVAYFYGGKGFDLEYAEHSVLTNVISELNDVGFRFAKAFNGNTMLGCIARQNATRGVDVNQTQSNAWLGGVIESNEKTGWYGEGMISWLISGGHFENNNSTSTSGEYALELNATPAGGALGGPNQEVTFLACTFNGTRDRIKLTSSGAGNVGITIESGYSSLISDPKISIDADTVGTRIINFADPNTPGAIEDNGIYTTVLHHGLLKAADGAPTEPSIAFGAGDRGFYNDTISNGVAFAVGGAKVGGTTSTGVYVLSNKVLSVLNGDVDASMGYDATVNGPKVMGIGGVTLGTFSAGAYTEKAKVTSGGLTVGVGTAVKTLLHGTATLVGGTIVVSNAAVTANSRIMLTSQVDGGTPGWLRISARSVGVSFTILSSSGTDTSTVAWEIIEP